MHKTADILMLSEVGKELTASHVKQEVGTKLYNSLCKIMPVDAFLLGIIEEKSNSIYFPTVIEENIFLDSFNFSITNKERLAVQSVINAQEYILMSDTDLNNYQFTVKVKPLTDNKMSSVIYEPLIFKNKTVGVLSVQSKNEHAFTSTNIEMLRTLASYTAVAMDNILAYEQIEDKNEALNKAIENLERVTYTDQLTGAHNRRFLDKYLSQSLVLQQRQCDTDGSTTNLDFGFILIDADHFKRVNDTYGHEGGDKVLCQLVDIIKTTCRQSDWVVRGGGRVSCCLSVY
ncbi:diguanylate cyclase [Colwellia sp. MSW7]|uniref:diguanylate cyclase n=1 Tax=Colwellia maritima TaxID=2912588 RepID=A0ABS9X0K0_9GAMM|nr:diguanylate cyclase [Colwellia maritima]MCI2283798.1 diguanylate cyclase [Colwellia maritima]